MIFYTFWFKKNMFKLYLKLTLSPYLVEGSEHLEREHISTCCVKNFVRQIPKLASYFQYNFESLLVPS